MRAPGGKDMNLKGLSCRARVALLCDFLDGELPAPRRRLLQAHRRSCRPCAEVLGGLTRTVAALRRLKRVKAPAAARRALRAAVLLHLSKET